jgi:hypothetical protein
MKPAGFYSVQLFRLEWTQDLIDLSNNFIYAKGQYVPILLSCTHVLHSRIYNPLRATAQNLNRQEG